jgi:hypothetical protein
MSVTLQPVNTVSDDPLGEEWHFPPQYVPSTPEDVFTSDVQVTLVHLSNTSSNPVTVTITDKQGTPLDFVPGVSIDPNSDHIRIFPATGRFCPGGATWFASEGSAVVGYMRGRV